MSDIQVTLRGSRVMPDIASKTPAAAGGRLRWVGMSGMEFPILWLHEGQAFRTPARAEAYVSLDDPSSRGIHMSRLFLTLEETLTKSVLSPASVRKTLEAFLASHTGISQASFLKLNWDVLVERPALKSSYKGWRKYPVEMVAELREGELSLRLKTQVLYSSTCPCSAALARQLIQEEFRQSFGNEGMVETSRIGEWLGSERGIVATPHSQRSEADLDVVLDPEFTWEQFPVLPIVDTVEGALQTAVQAAVKREDEQEFARLNGQNLMFCEDAARRMKQALLPMKGLKDFTIRARHIESLHPHDAVAVVGKWD